MRSDDSGTIDSGTIDAGTIAPRDVRRLDIVVVSYRNPEMVVACVESALEHGGPAATVHVVDNCSPDGTADVVEAACPRANVVRRGGNDGFAVANNHVLRHVDGDYALLLNPDAMLEPGTVEHLVDLMEREPDIGMTGCRLVTADGGLDHAAKRNVPTPASALRYFVARLAGRRTSQYVAPEVDPFGTGDVEAINGAFMLVRVAALRDVGLLDESYWMYGEDLDWCVRFRQAGWRVHYDGTVAAVHLKGGSSGSVRPLRLNYHFHRSMAIFYDQHGRSGNVLVDGVVKAGIWSRFAAMTFARGAWRARRALTRAAPGGAA